MNILGGAVLEVALVLGTASLDVEADALALKHGLELALLSVGGRHCDGGMWVLVKCEGVQCWLSPERIR